MDPTTLIIVCLVLAGATQRMAKDWWTGVKNGGRFPSQTYRQRRMELREQQRAAGTPAPVRGSARQYVADMKALAWANLTERHGRYWQRRHDQWRDRQDNPLHPPRPMRDFFRLWWHTGPRAHWHRGWQNAQTWRHRRVADRGDLPDRLPPRPSASIDGDDSDRPPASVPAGPTPVRREVSEVPGDMPGAWEDTAVARAHEDEPTTSNDEESPVSIPSDLPTQQNTAPVGEPIGLTGTVNFAQQWAGAAGKAAANGADHAAYATSQGQQAAAGLASIEAVISALQQSDTSGPALSSFAEAQQHMAEAQEAYGAAGAAFARGQEAFEEAAQAFETAHRELSRHLQVKDAYQATSGRAGKKDFALAE